jgi:hypothetical protein
MLAEAYQREGATPDERTENITDQFHRMPPIARRQVKAELDQLAVDLSDVAMTVAAAQRRLESSAMEEYSRAG